MKSLVWAWVLAIGSGCVAFGAEPGRAETAFQVLKTVPLFGTGGVGFAGTMSEGEKALRQLLAQQDSAKPLLLKLLTEATQEGRVYALLGLKQLDETEFKSRLHDLEKQSFHVRTIRGCIVTDRSIAEVAKDIEAGRYDLPPENIRR